ncbi:MAG: GDP-mannose mannosyl hydrolase [Jejuia sp.]
MSLAKADFLNIIDKTPLISIDLVIRDASHSILMGLRTNEPAKGFWFTPGGRILKNETIQVAFHRISQKELGYQFNFEKARLLNAFNHIYDTNFDNAPNINTHYVVLAYEIAVSQEQVEKLLESPDEQHTTLKWMSLEDEDITMVHPLSKAYFEYI